MDTTGIPKPHFSVSTKCRFHLGFSLVHTADGTGPYEAKAIGELANNAIAAAIANAVADATGCQIFELPITAERVYAALQAGGGAKSIT